LGSSVHLVLEVLAKPDLLLLFFYGDNLLLCGHWNHVPGITHLPYDNPFESDLVYGNNYKQEMVGLSGEGLVEMVI